MKRCSSLRLLAAITILSCAEMLPAQGAAPWQEAAKTYETAMSSLKGRRAAEAAAAFEAFVTKFSTNELVPDAWLQLGECRRQQQDMAGYLEAQDNVIKKFKGSRFWFNACWNKLIYLRDQKTYDEFFHLLDQMAAESSKRVPLLYSSTDPFSWYDVIYTTKYPAGLHWPPHTLPVAGWEASIVRAADTPERAQKALAILGPTLLDRKDDLPANWQVTHVRLLARAGQEDQAAAMLQSYASKWGEDTRGIHLWVLWAQACREAKDVKGEDQAYAELVKRYLGCGTLTPVLYERLAALRLAGRKADLASLGEVYVKAYPVPGKAFFAEAQVDPLVPLRAAAVKGDANAVAEVARIVDVRLAKDAIARTAYMVQVYLEMKKPQQAAQTARALLDDGLWSTRTYDSLRAWSAAGPEMAALLAEAQKKYGIFAADPNGPAGKVLADLNGRIADAQVRHMEELGKKLLAEHTQTAEAVQACQLLYTYYSEKVLPKERDEWYNRLLATYPRHPVTQAVLLHRLRPLEPYQSVSVDYKAMGEALDTIRERFPLVYPFWEARRFTCAKQTGDKEGIETFGKEYRRVLQEQAAEQMAAIQAAAMAGNLGALEQLANSDPNLYGPKATPLAAGDFWMHWADKLKGTQQEVFCLHKAWANFMAWSNDVAALQYDKAIEAIRRLQESPDPEARQASEFADIGVMLLAARTADPNVFDATKAEAAMKAIDQRLPKSRIYRDVSGRLYIDALAGLGRDNRFTRRVLDLLGRLSSSCPSRVDQNTLSQAKARLLYAEGGYAEASEEWMTLAEAVPSAWGSYGLYEQAIASARPLGAARQIALMERYLKKVEACQDFVPSLLLAEAQLMLAARVPGVDTIRARLARYPASAARGTLENLLKPPPKTK